MKPGDFVKPDIPENEPTQRLRVWDNLKVDKAPNVVGRLCREDVALVLECDDENQKIKILHGETIGWVKTVFVQIVT